MRRDDSPCRAGADPVRVAAFTGRARLRSAGSHMHRWAFGTPMSTWSTCLPQPSKVNFRHDGQTARWHTITSLGSSLEIHDIHAITTRNSRIYNSFRSSFLAPVWAVLMEPNHDPSYLAGGHENPDMRGRCRISVAESISLSGVK